MTPTTVTVSSRLVRHLRIGALRELGRSLAILQVEVDTTMEPETYFRALDRFDEARGLLDVLGVVESPDQADIEHDLELWPRLILKALESQHDLEVIRLQDAVADGYVLPMRDVPALRSLVNEIRERTGLPSRAWRTPVALHRMLATRRTRWSRRRDV